MKSTGARSSNELQKVGYMTEYQDGSPSNGRQGDTPYWEWLWCMRRCDPSGLVWIDKNTTAQI